MTEPKYNNADICEIAHEATEAICKLLNIQLDRFATEDDNEPEYTEKATAIFNRLHELIETILESETNTTECNDCTKGVTVYDTTRDGTCSFCGRLKD